MSTHKGSIVITGCNGGLGKAFVAEFLQSSNATTYKGQFGVRSPSTATALQAILASSPSAKEHEIITVDLSTLSSVRSCAQDINSRVQSGIIPPIRALVLNAALQHVKGQTCTNDGLESNFAVNYLANFLLVLLLLSSMDKQIGRIVLTSSWTHDPSHPLNGHIKDPSHKIILHDPHDLAKPKEDDKPGDEYNAGMRRYGMSKTLLIMWMHELQRRLSASESYSNISVLAVDPGSMTETSLFRDSPFALRIFFDWIATPLSPLLVRIWPNGYFRTAEKSAHDLLVACFDEGGALGKHPKAVYLNGSVVAGTSEETRDEGKQGRLWDASVEISGVRDEESALRLR